MKEEGSQCINMSFKHVQERQNSPMHSKLCVIDYRLDAYLQLQLLLPLLSGNFLAWTPADLGTALRSSIT